MKKLFIISVLLVLTISSSFAQNQFGQTINPWSKINPALHNNALSFLDAVPVVNLTAGARLQGFDNNPKNASLLASGLLTDDVSGSFKLNMYEAGLMSNLDAQLAFGYKVFLSGKGDKLSFFLAGHLIQDRLSLTEVEALDLNDPGLSTMSESQIAGNASAGFAFFRENKYYVGVSSFNLIETKGDYLSEFLLNKRQRAYYLLGSYNFVLNQEFQLEPSLAVLYANELDLQGGLTLKYDKKFWFGTSYNILGIIVFDIGITVQSWSFGFMGSYGLVDAVSSGYTYKMPESGIFIRKVFNEGRRQKG